MKIKRVLSAALVLILMLTLISPIPAQAATTETFHGISISNVTKTAKGRDTEFPPDYTRNDGSDITTFHCNESATLTVVKDKPCYILSIWEAISTTDMRDLLEITRSFPHSLHLNESITLETGRYRITLKGDDDKWYIFYVVVGNPPELVARALPEAQIVGTQLTIPDGVTAIVADTLDRSAEYRQTGFDICLLPRYMANIESVVIPSSVKVIDIKAFYGLRELKEVIFYNGSELQEIRRFAFGACSKLEKIVLPKSVTYIGENAFSDSGLKEITLPIGLREIGDNAFARTPLKSLVIPDGAQIIGKQALFHCFNMTDLTIPASVVVLENMFGAYDDSGEVGSFNFPAEIKSKLTIHGASGSAAEKYANRWGIKFNAVSTSTTQPPVVTQSQANVSEAQRMAEFKSEIERRYSVKITLGEGFDYMGTLTWMDEVLSMVPPAVHNALVAHFKAKGQIIKLNAYIQSSGHPAFYNHANATIGFDETGGYDPFSHEYGHMLHNVVWDKIGKEKFNNEFQKKTGHDIGSEGLAGFYQDYLIDSYRQYSDYNYEGVKDLVIAYDKIASSALRIDSIFHPSFYNAHTPSSWAVEAVGRAFGDSTAVIKDNAIVEDFCDSRVYQLPINRGEFAQYIVRMLDNAYERKTGKRLIIDDGKYRTMLLDLATDKYVYVGEFSPKPLRKFDDYPSLRDDGSIAVADWYGLMTGTSDYRFSPRSELTREQAAVILYRASTLLGLPDAGGTATIADSAQVSSWAVDGVNWAVRNDIMSGTGGGNFNPKGTYTFEQAIVTLVRLYDSVPAK